MCELLIALIVLIIYVTPFEGIIKLNSKEKKILLSYDSFIKTKLSEIEKGGEGELVGDEFSSFTVLDDKYENDQKDKGNTVDVDINSLLK